MANLENIHNYVDNTIQKYIFLISKKYSINYDELYQEWVNPTENKKINKSFQSDFSIELLKEHYFNEKRYVQEKISISKKYNNRTIRNSGIPEYISENIIKFAIQKQGDNSVYWNCEKGDLVSDVSGKLECKCFTSNGPISFSPSSGWDKIYFLDARQWLKDKYTIYEVELKYSSNEWGEIMLNKTETFRDQCKQKRRPRIQWDKLYPQISSYCKVIFDDTFYNLII